MSSKGKVPLGRPSSPRKFFARLYGHLETNDENKDKDKDRIGNNKVPGPEKSLTEESQEDVIDNCEQEVREIHANTVICKPKVAWSKIVAHHQEEERRPERVSNLPLLGLPFFPQGFLPAGSNNSPHSLSLVQQNSLQHFHGLPIHGQPVHHLHGLSAFRKFFHIFS